MAGKGKGRGPAGKGKPTGKAKGAPARRAGRSPVWLIVFAVAFAAIFIVFAVAQGLSAPGVPAGDAAVVKDAPGGEGKVSEAEVKRGTGQQIAAGLSEGKFKKAPKPGSKPFKEAQEAAQSELLNEIWIEGEGEELGIVVTKKQIETEGETIKKANFPGKAFKEFLEKTHFTLEDFNDRVKLQILSTEIQEQVSSGAPPPTKEEVENYYESEKSTQFTTPASRDVRVVVNKDKGQVEAAKKAIEAGKQSDKAWEAAAKKFSSDPTTKGQGGLQKGITEEFVKGDLKKAIFETPTGQLAGPVEFEKNFLLIEPVKITAQKVKPLAEVKAQISQTLAQQGQQEFLSEFITQFQTKWSSRTYCAADFVTEMCSNYKGSAHPASAAPACYEADPKEPAKECPAPVTMTTPALPGSTTVAKPTGERLVQRPRPVGLKEGAAAEAEAKAAEEAAAIEAQAGGAPPSE